MYVCMYVCMYKDIEMQVNTRQRSWCLDRINILNAGPDSALPVSKTTRSSAAGDVQTSPVKLALLVQFRALPTPKTPTYSALERSC